MANANTTSSAHTPGPWNLAIRFDKNGMIVSNNVNVCQVSPDSEGGSDQEIADAYLIAAAPDLLNALEFCLEYLKANEEDEIESNRIAVAEKAIAKAKGE